MCVCVHAYTHVYTKMYLLFGNYVKYPTSCFKKSSLETEQLFVT